MANTFIWQELNTPDPKAAAAFYASVIGWSVQGYEGGSDYWQFSAGERSVAGMMRLSESTRAAGPHWMSYLGVADVEAEVERVRRDGGQVHVPPSDIPNVGRFAMITDPQGVALMVLKPLPREVPPPVPLYTPGHVGWHELHTTDWRAALDFYSAHFGWTQSGSLDMGKMGTYQLFAIDGVDKGGMMTTPLPRPQWLHYFNVADIDAAHAAIQAGGGRTMNGPREVPGGGFTLQALDPQGAMFAVTGPRKSKGA